MFELRVSSPSEEVLSGVFSGGVDVITPSGVVLSEEMLSETVTTLPTNEYTHERTESTNTSLKPHFYIAEQNVRINLL